MLIGNFQSKLDLKKGRTALPVKFRRELGKKVIITSGFENSLMIISQTNWQKVVGDIINKPFTSGPARETDRFLLGSAFELDLDEQGRFIIPETLRKYAQLTENIVFIGIGNRVEIWEELNWQKYQSYLDNNIERIVANLNEPKQGPVS